MMTSRRLGDGMFDVSLIASGLKLRSNGIWYGSGIDEELSYPKGSSDSCFLIEDESFWFKHRGECIISAIKQFPPRDNGAIFDIGGGDGYVSLGLTDAGFESVLVEPSQEGAMNAKSRGLKNIVCATTDSAKFRVESLPAVGLFDVVEHIEDDVLFLKSIHDLIDKNGFLYMTVPAYSYLWSNDDVTAGHYRRYGLNEMAQRLKSAGFSIEYSSYIFRFLPIPIFLFRAIPYYLGINSVKNVEKRKKNANDHLTNDSILLKIINVLLKSELKNICKKISMRFGGSCLIVAKKIQFSQLE